MSGEQEPTAFHKPTSVVLFDLKTGQIDKMRHGRTRTGWLRDQIAGSLTGPATADIIGAPVTPEVIDLFGLALTELLSNADGEAPQRRSKRLQRRLTRVSVEAKPGGIRISVGDNEPAMSNDERPQTLVPSADTNVLLSSIQEHGYGRFILENLGVTLDVIPLDDIQPDGTRKIVFADIPVTQRGSADDAA